MTSNETLDKLIKQLRSENPATVVRVSRNAANELESLKSQLAEAQRDITILCQAVYELNHRPDGSAINNQMGFNGQLSDFALQELTK